MLNAYCNALHPRNGELRDARCYWKIDGRDLITFTVANDNNWWALHEAVRRLLAWSIENHQPLKIHVVNMAIPQNRDLIRICGQSGSELVWLRKEEFLKRCPEAPESNKLIGAQGSYVTHTAHTVSL